MQKAAAFLKNTRQEKGFSVDEVSKNTKISPSVIRALEDGRLDNIDQVYLKGFLKLYCRFLGIDWEEFQKEYSLSFTAKQTHKPIKAQRPEVSSGRSAPLIFFLAKNKKIILIFLSLVAVLLFCLLLFRGCPFVSNKIHPADNKIPDKISGALPPTKAKTQTTPKPQNTPTQADRLAQKNLAGEIIKLEMLLKEDSFVKVAVDGRAVFRGVMRRGKREIWTAKEKIELSVGNAAGIELEVDGKRYSPLGRHGQSIKGIVIDHNGLRVM